MSRIVVLAGSVRKGGNTDILVQAFAEAAGKCHEVELISVADYAVHPCIGCNSCYTREGHRCFQDDDMLQIYDKLNELGIEPLYDDRDERPGVKFKDMELIGIPMRITVGKLAGENKVEFRLRTESENTVLTVDEAIAKVTELSK